MEPLNYESRGYLREAFRLFHLSGEAGPMPDWHYHTFHKLVFLLAGKAGYSIEGERYTLQPGDCVLVGSGSIHRPEVAAGVYYERVVLYISPEHLRACSTEDCDLSRCFGCAGSTSRYVFRCQAELLQTLSALEQACEGREFGSELLKQALFLQLLVLINRRVLDSGSLSDAACDSKIVAVLQYLNRNLSSPVSVDALAERFYISKYHLMRRFKEATGYTIHNYLSEKRLLRAAELLRDGEPVTGVFSACGYRDYSTFLRAFRKRFGCMPSGFRPGAPLPDGTEAE